MGPRAGKAGGKGSSGPGNAILSSSGMMKNVIDIFVYLVCFWCLVGMFSIDFFRGMVTKRGIRALPIR